MNNMRKYYFIGIGGMLGAVLRYVIKGIQIDAGNNAFPVNTFIINITGSFILALILTIAFEIWEMDADIRIGIATGFLGAYTTFSTFCKETVTLMAQGNVFIALLYVVLSTVFGFLAAYLGVIIAREVVYRIFNSKKA